MKKLQIFNDYNYHYEIIESVIVKYRELFKVDESMKIYLYVKGDEVYRSYIRMKYPDIEFGRINNYDYYVNCTVYDKDFMKLDKNSNSRRRYISHEMTARLVSNPNVYFLAPFAGRNYLKADVLPFAGIKRKTKRPVYVVQGNLNHNRRHLGLLVRILRGNYKYDFEIRMVGNGYLPNELRPYRNRIVLRNNLNFVDYHEQFLDVYCILPMISKKTHPHYYRNKLTSSINYARGYGIKCLIDKDLQDIYRLGDVEVFMGEDDIVKAFGRTLENYYK